MEKREETLELQIEKIAKEFLETSKNKKICVISHFDTDGIASAAIITKTLKKLDKEFSIEIIKNLEKEFIFKLPKEKIILFLDLASGSLENIKNAGLEDVFILDHHEIVQEIPDNVQIANPQLHNKQKISGSGITYLFCKSLDSGNKELAKLAVLGMIGDRLEKDIGKINKDILEDAETKTKRGLLIYPSTRPLNRALEYCSNPYIPGVTGNLQGTLELLREAGLKPTQKGYQSLLELNEKEMTKLVTAILLRNPKAKQENIVGDIFLLKFYNKMEDARELSARINACSRFGDPGAALQFCMESPKSKKRAEQIHVKYKQLLISGLRFAEETEKITGKEFVIINAKQEIKDTMIGTIASIISSSAIYESGTAIIGMAYCEKKIKISARSVGNEGRNLREVLAKVVDNMGGEVGGHEFAAGCLIDQEKENDFINHIKKNFEIEVVKV